jgi:hypothetical protein
MAQTLTKNQRKRRRKKLTKLKQEPPRSKQSLHAEAVDVFTEDCYRKKGMYEELRTIYKRENNTRLPAYNKLNLKDK